MFCYCRVSLSAGCADLLRGELHTGTGVCPGVCCYGAVCKEM